MLIKRLDTKNKAFQQELQKLHRKSFLENEALDNTVLSILKRVKAEGDKALLKYTALFDGYTFKNSTELEIPHERLKKSWEALPQALKNTLKAVAKRIQVFHEKNLPTSWRYKDEYGSILGQQITPIEKVGLYVPGGKASYPSSILMNTIPAKIAGVKEIIMATPPSNNYPLRVSSIVLATAYLAEVDQLFTLGGAHAIAALAFGTATVPAVDKIVGPGNAYVTSAKKHVFGRVGIDMLAGPSEVVVIADGSVSPTWVVYDLMAQAEHDAEAKSLLLCPQASYCDEVASLIEELVPKANRREIIQKSFQNQGALITVKTLEEAIELSNQIAPEHLELLVKDPDRLLPFIQNAGAIFMGAYSAETFGDYSAGPNHVLPTNGTARFASPLCVMDFQKRSSVVRISEKGASCLGPLTAQLAKEEGLFAHAAAAHVRTKFHSLFKEAHAILR
ncbi:MAG: histidinol dehydrogenase [Gammaproteobacteria bacterium]|nr:histidinol dehydrogenase [Gammaproteobacteria bacterium]